MRQLEASRVESAARRPASPCPGAVVIMRGFTRADQSVGPAQALDRPESCKPKRDNATFYYNLLLYCRNLMSKASWTLCNAVQRCATPMQENKMVQSADNPRHELGPVCFISVSPTLPR